MKRRLFCLGLLGTVQAAAQPAWVQEPPALPLRNVLIELRVDEGSSQARQELGAGVQVQLQPGGSRAELQLQAQGRALERSSHSQQQVLVLNGRTAVVLSGLAVPLRLRQMVSQGGVRRLVTGTVWLQAGTGLTATPLWDGGDMMWLELAASQGAAVGAASAAATTTLLLPLETWTTVAESDEALQDTRVGFGPGGVAGSQRSAGSGLRVQVRVSVR